MGEVVVEVLITIGAGCVFAVVVLLIVTWWETWS